MVCTRKRRREMEVDQSAMQNLPTHILIEIISRLPIKAVVALRCASKSLLKLLSDPNFQTLYSTIAPTELLLRISSLFEELFVSTTLYLADPKFLNDDSSTVVDMKFSAVFDIKKFNVRPKNTLNLRANKTNLMLINSCRGLVSYCGLNTPTGFAVICNPITGEFVTVPAPPIRVWDMEYGFGFSPKDNAYKLLRLLTPRDDGRYRRVCEIYTFGGNGSWRNVANCPHVLMRSSPTFLAGVLHWFSWHSLDIVTFDFDTEQFGNLATPPYVRDMVRSSIVHHLSIGLLGDCLYTLISVSGDSVQVWVMKEYGVQSSWIVELSIPRDTAGHDVYVPIKYLQNGEILMFRNSKDIVCYCPNTTSVNCIGRFSSSYEKVFIKPSLVSLKMMLGSDVKVHNVKSWNAHKSCTEVAAVPRWCASSAAPLE